MISIIVPAYNEEQTLPNILERIIQIELRMEKEIIVVDDGSLDNTSKVVGEFNTVKLLRHEKNQGKAEALRTGLKYCTGDIIVFQDADGEYNPKDIPHLIKPLLEEEADVVYGSRFLGKMGRMSFSHWIGNKFLTWVTRILYKADITDMETGYKVFKREVFGEIKIESEGFEIEPEITAKVLKSDFQLVEVPIGYKYREKGEAKIGWKDGVKSLIRLVKEKFGE